MMPILRSGLSMSVLEKAFRTEMREERERSEAKSRTVRKTKAKRSRPKASEEPPRSWRAPDTRAPDTAEDSGGRPCFITPL
jgi:hypothetical protein